MALLEEILRFLNVADPDERRARDLGNLERMRGVEQAGLSGAQADIPALQSLTRLQSSSDQRNQENLAAIQRAAQAAQAKYVDMPALVMDLIGGAAFGAKAPRLPVPPQPSMLGYRGTGSIAPAPGRGGFLDREASMAGRGEPEVLPPLRPTENVRRFQKEGKVMTAGMNLDELRQIHPNFPVERFYQYGLSLGEDNPAVPVYADGNLVLSARPSATGADIKAYVRRDTNPNYSKERADAYTPFKISELRDMVEGNKLDKLTQNKLSLQSREFQAEGYKQAYKLASMYEKVEAEAASRAKERAGPFGKREHLFSSGGTSATESIPKKWVEIADTFKEKLGIPGELFLFTPEEAQGNRAELGLFGPFAIGGSAESRPGTFGFLSTRSRFIPGYREETGIGNYREAITTPRHLMMVGNPKDFPTFAHELSHSWTNVLIGKAEGLSGRHRPLLPDEAIADLRQYHKEWLQPYLDRNVPFKEYYKDLYTPPKNDSNITTPIRDKIKEKPYWGDFDEWIANQVAKSFVGDKNAYDPRVIKTIRKHRAEIANEFDAAMAELQQFRGETAGYENTEVLPPPPAPQQKEPGNLLDFLRSDYLRTLNEPAEGKPKLAKWTKGKDTFPYFIRISDEGKLLPLPHNRFYAKPLEGFDDPTHAEFWKSNLDYETRNKIAGDPLGKMTTGERSARTEKIKELSKEIEVPYMLASDALTVFNAAKSLKKMFPGHSDQELLAGGVGITISGWRGDVKKVSDLEPDVQKTLDYLYKKYGL